MNHIFWMHKRLGETVQSSLRNFANLLGNTTRKDPDSFLVEPSSWAQFPPAWQMSSRKMEGGVGRYAWGGGGGSILRSPSFCARHRSGVHVSTLWKAGFSFFRVLSPFFSMGFLHERLCGGEITIFSFNFSSPYGLLNNLIVPWYFFLLSWCLFLFFADLFFPYFGWGVSFFYCWNPLHQVPLSWCIDAIQSWNVPHPAIWWHHNRDPLADP